MTMKAPRPFSTAPSRLALVAVVLAAIAAWAAPTASAQGDWYWTPGACKSVLQTGGVELADGRTFHVASSFCIGLGGPDTCQWSSNRRVRLYNAFVVFTRSYDGAVRTFTLFPVAKDDFRATQPRLLGVEPDAVEFREFIAPVATAVARRQHGSGCAPYRG
jgi:hypothetical protein